MENDLSANALFSVVVVALNRGMNESFGAKPGLTPSSAGAAAPVRLLALATAVPEHELAQGEVEAFAAGVFSGESQRFQRLRPAFTNAGIARRRPCVPLAWMSRSHGWAERARVLPHFRGSLNAPVIIIVLVAAQRLVEAIYAERNARVLLAAGATKAGRRHYPLFVLLHAGWIAALLLVVTLDPPVTWPLVAFYGILQVGRAWVMVSLGRLWTTRAISPPGIPLVARGPYRYLRHLNYAIVVCEIAVLPLAFGAWEIALAFTVPNLALLAHRVRVEDRLLAPRRTPNARPRHS